MNRKLPRWPLVPVALSAMVSIWGGWVSLGALTGFGVVHLLPGIDRHVTLNLALTLPVSVEAYAAYAMAAWLGPWRITVRARRFAMCSAMGALVLGVLGQASYHLLTADHAKRAPDVVTVIVSGIPVAVVGFGAALHHLMTHGSDVSKAASEPARPSFWAGPLGAAVAARIAPRPVPATGTAGPPALPVAETVPVPVADTPAVPVAPAAEVPVAMPVAEPIAVPPADEPAPPVAVPGPVPAARRTASAVRKVQRKGARDCTDDDLRAAIREMRDASGSLPTKYRAVKDLGMGDKRAERLLAEVGAEDRAEPAAIAEPPVRVLHAVQDGKSERTEAS